MTVNISKDLLGITCIIAGAFLPLILSALTLLPPGFDPGGRRLIHFTNLLMLIIMAVTVLVNVRESSVARSRGGTSLEQLPRDAATLLTGAVGMSLLFSYLVKATSFSSAISPTAFLFVYALTSTVLLMEGCCLLSSSIARSSGEVKESPKE